MQKKMGIRRVLCSLALCAGVAFPGAFPALAESVAYDAPIGLGNQAFGGNLGESFQVNQSIVINDIGVYDSNLVANLAASGGTSDFAPNTTIEVALFDVNTAGQTPTVTQVTQTYSFVAGATYNVSPAGGYALQALTGPDAGLVLNASTTDTYWIVAQGFNANDPNGNAYENAGVPAILDNSGALTFLAPSAYDLAGAPLEVPMTSDILLNPPDGTANQYEAGTFDFTATPEPGTMLLLGSTLAGMGLIGRGRRRQNG